MKFYLVDEEFVGYFNIVQKSNYSWLINFIRHELFCVESMLNRT